jgi:ABC-type polysaccharide/polyol phosphate export permease
MWNMALRDLKIRYAGSYLGVFWTVIVPLMTSGVYILVFSFIMRGNMAGEFIHLNFIVFYFTGYTPWLLFSETLGRNLNIIRENAGIITKIQFPSQILPFSVFLSSLVSHIVLLFVCGALLLVYNVALSDRFYLIFIYFIFLSIITMGISLLLSSVCVFISDLVQVILIIINLLFFLTPILYPYQLIESYAPSYIIFSLLKLNPFHHISQGYRLALINLEIPVDIQGILILSIISLLIFLVGVAVFKKLKPHFNDIL